MKGMDRLLELKAIDSAVDRMTSRRAELESGGELAAARTAMEEAESRLGEIRLALDEVDRDQLRLEHEISSLGSKAEAEEKRLYDGSIANAKELEALQHEIANLKDRRSRVEDDLLERMVRREELEPRAAAAEKESSEARERVEIIGGDASRELDEIAAGLQIKASERAALVRAVDEELLELYEELRSSKKGVGVARLVDGVCEGCHQKLSAMELDKLKKTEGVKRCEYCRRIVIFA